MLSAGRYRYQPEINRRGHLNLPYRYTNPSNAILDARGIETD